MACGASLKIGIDDVSMPELRAKPAQQIGPRLSAHTVRSRADFSEQGPDARSVGRHRYGASASHGADALDGTPESLLRML